MSPPSSPAGGTGQPLQQLSHNAQRESALFSSPGRINFAESASNRDSSVHEKINQFNTLAMQSKSLERKTADAALKRAMLGREEAEAEMRRYRDEARLLRKQVEDVTFRERKVSERLEAVMETHGRTKEQHAHAQQVWEKEIRRCRKEAFKAQSELVKVKEELKSCRAAQKAAEEALQTMREQSKEHEQAAFDAQYNLVGLQEQLNQAQERVKMLEQELDALKAAAKNEEEVRRLTLAEINNERDADDAEGPRKRQRLSTDSLPAEPEIETLKMLWQWEKQRADRAVQQVQFLEAECQLKLCPTGKSFRQSSSSRRSSPRRKRASLLQQMSDASDQMILSESFRASAEAAPPKRSKTDMLRVDKEPRRSTIFLPAEGIFRTVSQAEADALAAQSATTASVSPTESAPSVPITPTDSDPMYRRTPSVDPPDFAVLSKERTSLLSLLNAPHRQDPTPVFNIPTTPGPDPATVQPEYEEDDEEQEAPSTIKPTAHLPEPATASLTAPLTDPLPSTKSTPPFQISHEDDATPVPAPRPHTTASHYPTTTTTTTVTTTKVPLRAEPTNADPPTLSKRLLTMQRTPSRQTGDAAEHNSSSSAAPGLDAPNAAMTPMTMTREQALAQIRERRGARARSVGRAPLNTSGGTGGGNGSGNAGSGNGSGGGEGVRRKVSGGDGGAGGSQGVRRKVSSGELVGGGARGRERDRREVSAPTATVGGSTVRGAVPAARRVRS